TLHRLTNCEKRRSCHNLYGVARLKDGVTVQMALADMTSIAKQLEVQYPGSNRGQGASVMPLSEEIVGDIRPILLVLLGGAGLLIWKDMLSNIAYLRGIGLNLHVVAFAGLISLLAAALFASTPVLRLPLAQLREGLTDGGRNSAGTFWRRFGANLVVLELAVAVVLLVGAGLLGKSFYK